MTPTFDKQMNEGDFGKCNQNECNITTEAMRVINHIKTNRLGNVYVVAFSSESVSSGGRRYATRAGGTRLTCPLLYCVTSCTRDFMRVDLKTKYFKLLLITSAIYIGTTVFELSIIFILAPLLGPSVKFFSLPQ